MTFEKLFNFSADEWDKLNPTELEEFCKKFHHITKPNKIIDREIHKPKRVDNYQGQLKNIMTIAEKLGIDFKK